MYGLGFGFRAGFWRKRTWDLNWDFGCRAYPVIGICTPAQRPVERHDDDRLLGSDAAVRTRKYGSDAKRFVALGEEIPAQLPRIKGLGFRA